jgi:ATP-dependent Lon protease
MSEQENWAEFIDEKKEEPSSKGEETLVLARQVLPLRLPIIPLMNRPFFPKMMVPIVVEEARLKNMINDLIQSETKHVGLISVRPHEHDPSQPAVPIKTKDLYTVGVVGEIVQVGQMAPDGPVQCVVAVRERFQIESVVREDPTILVAVKYLIETDMSVNEELKAYSLAIIDGIKELMRLSPLFKEEMTLLLNRSSVNEPGRLADFAASMTTASIDELQDVLESFNIAERVRKVLLLLKKEIEVSKLQVKITKQIEERLSKQQREFFLREQLKEIKKELGISKEGKEAELERFKLRLANLTLTEEAQQRIDEEMDKLALMEPSSPEFNVSRGYLDWLTVLPWGVFTEDSYDIQKAKQFLDEDHYGLDDVKQRILEFLSVGIMKGNISGSIICFVGPPGVGKTSIGKSIARSVGRQFYRFSVGGMRDEAEIKGHRRTYIGALPGKFIHAMKVCKTANPVIMIDEIDKLTTSFQGDPAAALLEVLDPEQNRDFLDHYLDVRFDLSNVFFLCTANQLDTIPRPLLDRMEIIKLSGYILEEKLEIAKKFLIPKQLREHGLQPKQLKISPAIIKEIIDGYAREPGVRGLENQIKKIVRKSVKSMVETKTNRVEIAQSDIRELLGRKTFQEEEIYQQPKPGVVMGLAWTSLGGDTLYIEATRVRTGNAGFKQTGQLGNVMVESSEIAYTFVRSLIKQRNDADRFFDENFIHLHVPAGATPKDGPSAGVTMATALYSLAVNKAVKPHLAMTGELSLTGLVMPIGGIKEKTIAAKRAKVKKIILPKQNQPDFEELPAHIRKGLTPYFVSSFEEIIRICL